MKQKNKEILNKNMKNDNIELNLIKSAQNGDEKAIDELYEKYKHFVVSICRKYYIMGGDSDDLVQEGMLGFFKAITTFDFDGHAEFLPYAKTLISHQVINAVKKANSGKASFLNERMPLNNQGEVVLEKENKVFGLPNMAFMPENEYIFNENYNQLLSLVKSKLSNYENEILKLYLQGYDYNDIIKKLDTNYKSVDNALSRIKNKLKNLNMGE